MPTPPTRGTYLARAGLTEARLDRSEATQSILQGVSTPTDCILHACTHDGRHLRPMRLRELLDSQQGWNSTMARRFLRRVAALLETDEDLSNKTVGWLIDPHCGGRRLLAWLDADAAREHPWLGFPFTPQPPDWSRGPATGA